MYNRKYDKIFLLMKQEISGFNHGERPAAGSAVLELRDGNGRFSVHVQGLKYLTGYGDYFAYIISSTARKTVGICAGCLKVDDNGKGMLKWEFNPDNIEGSGLTVEDMNVAAIMLKDGRKRENILAPLVGYRDSKINWKSDFQEYEKRKSMEAQGEVIHTAAFQKKEEPLLKAMAEEKAILEKEKREEKESKGETNISLLEQALELISGNDNLHTIAEGVSKELKKEPPKQEKSLSSPDNPSDAPQDKKQEVPKKETPVHEEKGVETKEMDIPKQMDNKEEASRKVEAAPVKPALTTEVSGKYIKETENPHEVFRKLTEKFQKELQELENLGVLTKQEVETIVTGKKKEIPLNDIDYLLQNNTEMEPFSEDKNCKWVRICLDELALLPFKDCRIMNQAFVSCGYWKYKHLILGKENGENGRYYVGIPDKFMAELGKEAAQLGFHSFRPCREGDAEHYGYWLRKL